MRKKLSILDLRRARRAAEKLARSGGGSLGELGRKSAAAVRRATANTPSGRLARELARVAHATTGGGGRSLSREAIRSMSKMPELGPMGRLIGDIEKYASGRGGGLTRFIGRMGPIGSLFQAVVGAIRGGGGVTEADLIAAAKVLTAAGYKVTGPGSAYGSTTASPPAAPPVIPPSVPGSPGGRSPGRSSPSRPQTPGSPNRSPPPPPGQQPGNRQQPPPGGVEPIMAPGSYQTNAPPLPGQESPFSHEILTPQSSNVFAFTYDPQTSTLYVTYKANKLHEGQVQTGRGRLGGQQQLRGRAGHTVAGKTNERGPMYAYFDVPARVFNRMQLAHSKGKFVWDELRIRGTIWGARYRYQLVQGAVTIQKGISGVYIPRKATKKGFTVRSVAVVGSGRRAFQSSTLPGQSGHSTRRR